MSAFSAIVAESFFFAVATTSFTSNDWTGRALIVARSRADVRARVLAYAGASAIPS